MHPPQWVCDELERLSPWARLGWHGERRQFAILDLYPARLAKGTFRELWDGKGPVFGRPYDHLARVPVWIYEVPPEEVFSGAVLARAKRFLTPLKPRLARSWQQRHRQRKRDFKERAGEQGSYLHWRARRSPHSGPQIAQKFIPRREKAIAAGDFRLRIDRETMPPVNPMGLT